MDLRQASLPDSIVAVLEKEGIAELRPVQEKAIRAGLLEGKNLLVCTPTSSGKTLVAELAMLSAVIEGRGKGLYIVPMKALATEKHRDFQRKWGHIAKVAVSIGDLDSSDAHLSDFDIIICTAEKLDSLIRHRAPWIGRIAVVVADEVHLINDPGRGPTLEVLLTILRTIRKGMQLIALSATIGNPEELALWLEAGLVKDEWRPVQLAKGVYIDGTVHFET